MSVLKDIIHSSATTHKLFKYTVCKTYSFLCYFEREKNYHNVTAEGKLNSVKFVLSILSWQEPQANLLSAKVFFLFSVTFQYTM